MSNEIKAKDIRDLLEETIEDVTNVAKGVVEVEGEELSTGLLNLDEVLGGLWPGELGEDDWKRVADAAGAISGYDLHVCCSRDVGMGDVVELAGQVLEGCDKGLIVVCGMRRIAEGCGPTRNDVSARWHRWPARQTDKFSNVARG